MKSTHHLIIRIGIRNHRVTVARQRRGQYGLNARADKVCGSVRSGDEHLIAQSGNSIGRSVAKPGKCVDNKIQVYAPTQ